MAQSLRQKWDRISADKMSNNIEKIGAIVASRIGSNLGGEDRRVETAKAGRTAATRAASGDTGTIARKGMTLRGSDAGYRQVRQRAGSPHRECCCRVDFEFCRRPRRREKRHSRESQQTGDRRCRRRLLRREDITSSRVRSTYQCRRDLRRFSFSRVHPSRIREFARRYPFALLLCPTTLRSVFLLFARATVHQEDEAGRAERLQP
ncbi:uncharacterized protein LOC128886692 [Hylaeus anthracinus]|uniref:uncharacterized protein LOC128886692 n=1 Tax=Hylaeus anthracinus TaxID=313031 RepID=UPI0023B8D1FE|nr:uncharacterized protein LOC128886692 [Hylaeus anthracinus]